MKISTLLDFIEEHDVDVNSQIFVEVNEDISSTNGVYVDHDGDLIVGKYEYTIAE